MKVMSKLTAVVLALAMAFTIAGCTPSGTAVESVELSRGSLALDVGQEERLTYDLFPAGATANEVRWISSDTSVATVSDSGVVRGESEGMATVRLTVDGKNAECNVVVTDSAKREVPVTGVTLAPRSLKLQLGSNETGQLTATVQPDNATDKTLAYTSSNPGVATVDGNGLVTAVSAGTTVVTASATNNVTGRCMVTVANADGSLGGDTEDEVLYVGAVPSLKERSQTFIMGMDASAVLSVEKARQENNQPMFKDFDGKEDDVFKIMKDNGVTDIRIRIWNNPYNSETGKSYGGGNCDVANAVEISKRCQAVGLGVIIDFHYSDFWADPGKQRKPKDWASFTNDEIRSAIGTFTEESLEQIKATNVTITMVQLGNETTGGMCGSSDWATVSGYMNAGAAAVRKVTGKVVDGGAKVAVHFTNAGNNDYVTRAQTLADNHVDYDVFGTSWYAYYSSHGTLTNLCDQLAKVHNQFNKEVMVLETAYAFSYEDYDGLGNTAFETTTQPITVQGMSNAVRDVIKAISDLGDYGLGICYWEGTWISASNSSDRTTNGNLCVKYGCGWATAEALEYDQGTGENANNGGTQVDNNAFWLSDGTPIQALKVFKLVYDGQTTDIKADYLDNSEVYYTVNEGPIELPVSVSGVLNTGSKLGELEVTWDVTEEQLEEYIANVGQYDVKGTTNYGGECHLTIWVMNVNLLKDGSFEEVKSYPDNTTYTIAKPEGWGLDYEQKTGELQLYVSSASQNALMGTNTFHFWDNQGIDFHLYQTLERSDIAEYGNGKYGASFDIQGGQGINMDIYAYITLVYNDGTESKTFMGNKVELTVWKAWHRTSVSGVEVGDNVKQIIVGIRVYADAESAQSGPWGNIDNCQFYYEG